MSLVILFSNECTFFTANVLSAVVTSYIQRLKRVQRDDYGTINL